MIGSRTRAIVRARPGRLARAFVESCRGVEKVQEPVQVSLDLITVNFDFILMTFERFTRALCFLVRVARESFAPASHHGGGPM
jgi:hypothetical protein